MRTHIASQRRTHGPKPCCAPGWLAGTLLNFQTSAAHRGRGGTELQWVINFISGISSCSLSGVLPDQDIFPHRINLTQDCLALRPALSPGLAPSGILQLSTAVLRNVLRCQRRMRFHFIGCLNFHTPEFLDSLLVLHACPLIQEGHDLP